MPDQDDNSPYIIHVRVEKVTVTPNTSLKAVTRPKNDRDLEDVVNVIRKSDHLTTGIEFIKGVLELTRETQ
jgi:hypothetical protein